MTNGNGIFTRAQREMLTAVLNRIIPAQDPFPGAGDLGGAQVVEEVAGNTARLRRLFGEGLAQLEIAAARRGEAGFAELSPVEQDDTLRQVEAERPDFFRELVRQCYNSYYTNPEVFDLIGYSLPDPADYRPLPFDESLLEPVRQRGQMWRPV
ncbi:gluconate 2-dehydrogenase subunit 3 family protein [Achromobacter marplatensis]|uniref:gluconate 2-dehydrogenase subunit 3 family protein n=1 Tax=Achromobacter marplatensis TaxID=470868 RepID=UPI003C785945